MASDQQQATTLTPEQAAQVRALIRGELDQLERRLLQTVADAVQEGFRDATVLGPAQAHPAGS